MKRLAITALLFAVVGSAYIWGFIYGNIWEFPCDATLPSQSVGVSPRWAYSVQCDAMPDAPEVRENSEVHSSPRPVGPSDTFPASEASDASEANAVREQSTVAEVRMIGRGDEGGVFFSYDEDTLDLLSVRISPVRNDGTSRIVSIYTLDTHTLIARFSGRTGQDTSADLSGVRLRCSRDVDGFLGCPVSIQLVEKR